MKNFLKFAVILISFTLFLTVTACSKKVYEYTTMSESHVNSTNLNERSSLAVVSLANDEQQQIMKLVKRGYSNYGYIQLDSEMQIAYKEIEHALLNVEDRVVISDNVFDKFNVLLRYISSDNPLFFWEPNEINYTQRVGGGYVMNFKYDFTKEEIFSILTEVDDYATEYCASIPDELSNFDKALIVHDKVVSSIEYDKTLSDMWRNDVYGGLVNNYASCLGYSKTFQYLMCRLSIDTLMAYGNYGEEQHAWNVINIDDAYYHVDTTFDDTSKVDSLNDGYTKIQHKYAFLSDEEITKTHEIPSEIWSYKLPECDSMQKNYFKMNDLVVTSTSMATVNTDIDNVLLRAISVSLAQKNSLIEIKFENEDIANEVIRTIENGELDSRVTMLCKLRGITSVDSRSYTPQGRILTYYFS